MQRIVVARSGPDGDDPSVAGVDGADAAARALRDAGHEVVDTGRRQGLEQVVATVVAEDADLVGLWVRGEAPERVLADLRAALAAQGADDVTAQVFGAGADAGEVAAWAAAAEDGSADRANRAG